MGMTPPRRQFLKTSTATAAAVLGGFCYSLAGKKLPPKTVRLGVIADLHHQFVDGGARRMEAFLRAMSEVEPSALVQLGDFTFPNTGGQGLADSFNAASRHSLHVIGNHDLDLRLTRQHCLDAWGMPSPYYRYDLAGLRLLILDGNERGSPTHGGGYPSYVGEQQLEWLSGELDGSELPVAVLSHQPLAGPGAVDNAAAVRKALEKHAPRILFCLNGHTHLDTVIEQAGIPYLHINSASYYWVGGKERTLFYRDPLFASLTIDPDEKTLSVAGRASRWDAKTPEEIGFFKTARGQAVRRMVTPGISDRTIRL